MHSMNFDQLNSNALSFPHSRSPSSPSGDRLSEHNWSLSPQQSLPADDQRFSQYAEARDERSFRQLQPEIVDNIASSLKLSPEYRELLLEFSQIHQALPTAQLLLAVHQQATIYQTQQIVVQAQTEYQEVCQILQEIKDMLRQNVQMSNAQKDEVVHMCKRLVFDAGRTSYNIAEEVMAALKNGSANNGFAPLFDSPARLKDLRSYVGRQASTAKNSLRIMIRDSVFATGKRLSVTQFTTKAAKHFLGAAVATKPVHIMHMTLYCAFARQNQDILNINSEHDQDQDAAENNSESEPPTKKKRGRVPKGQDFWSQMSAFFRNRSAEWGPDVLKSAGWKTYIEERIKEERQLHPDDLVSLIPQVAAAPPGTPNSFSGSEGPREHAGFVDGRNTPSLGSLAIGQTSVPLLSNLLGLHTSRSSAVLGNPVGYAPGPVPPMTPLPLMHSRAHTSIPSGSNTPNVRLSTLNTYHERIINAPLPYGPHPGGVHHSGGLQSAGSGSSATFELNGMPRHPMD